MFDNIKAYRLKNQEVDGMNLNNKGSLNRFLEHVLFNSFIWLLKEQGTGLHRRRKKRRLACAEMKQKKW